MRTFLFGHLPSWCLKTNAVSSQFILTKALHTLKHCVSIGIESSIMQLCRELALAVPQHHPLYDQYGHGCIRSD